jgi:hypothetical protein
MARVHINIEGFKRNPSGKRKVWQSDLKRTYCCEWWNPCYFVWEKNTRHNGYNGYNGYVSIKFIEVLNHV